ncbi:hypothetical protein K438DRAFT_1547239, partial [Mycena galopus ATCC 62051]
LTSNNPPLESEIPVIRDIVSDGQDRVEALDAQIYILQAAVAELVRKRDEAAESTRERRAILSPIRRVPPELICNIFDLTIQSSAEFCDPKSDTTEPPWYLGHICRRWRHYALS